MKFVFKKFFLLLILSLISSLMFATPASIEKISTESTGDKLQVEVVLSQSVKYHYFLLTKPDRLVVDFDDTKPIAIPLPNLSGTPWIRQFRAASNTPEKQRMVFELTEPIKATLTLAPIAKTKDWRLNIELQPSSTTIIKSATSLAPLPDLAAAHPAKATPATKTADAYLANTNCVSIVIDPGHGGGDPGAIGLHLTKEKNVTLAISRYLSDMINHTPGMCAYMTRSGDYFVSLRGRLNLARKKSADIFISIHADMFKNTAARGATVFALSQRGATSEAARWIAHSENVSNFLDIGETAEKDKDLQSVLMDISQNETINRSLILGKNVLLNLDEVSKLHHTIVEQAGFVVLKSPDIPSILVETGFLSNVYEEAQLTQSAYQKKIATAIYRGIMKYSEQYSLPAKQAKK
ncbi:MAG: N-acetylmuramoyl-L-alanine amidase [Gammaproteobacteria bacterium]|nr:N-acetylmuramoyl-L-alanine amidase [Gammaproteobacteria bacterium]